MRRRKVLPDVFTIGEVARICQVSSQKVRSWADSGLLASFRIPGGNDRRVLRTTVIAFLAENGMPSHWIESVHREV